MIMDMILVFAAVAAVSLPVSVCVSHSLCLLIPLVSVDRIHTSLQSTEKFSSRDTNKCEKNDNM